MIEPGQLLVAASGFLMTKVIDKCDNSAILNSSAFNISSWYTPKLLIPHLDFGDGRLIGNTNWKEDIFISNVDINSINIGDKVIFGLVGAYYKTTQRNLHGYKFPIELYFKNGNIKKYNN